MAAEFSGGPLKTTVNLTAEGNIAQTGDTASGTKVIQFLNIAAIPLLQEAFEQSDPEMLVNPLEVAQIVANLLGTTYYPLTTNYNINIKSDGTTEKSKLSLALEAKRNGNVES